MGGFFVLRAEKMEDGGVLCFRCRKIEEPTHLRRTPIFEEIAPPPSSGRSSTHSSGQKIEDGECSSIFRAEDRRLKMGGVLCSSAPKIEDGGFFDLRLRGSKMMGGSSKMGGRSFEDEGILRRCGGVLRRCGGVLRRRGGSSKMKGVIEDVGGFFEDGKRDPSKMGGVSSKMGGSLKMKESSIFGLPSSKPDHRRTPHLRSSQPKIEELPSSFFEALNRRKPPSFCDLQDRRNLHLRSSGRRLGRRSSSALRCYFETTESGVKSEQRSCSLSLCRKAAKQPPERPTSQQEPVR